MRGANGGHYSSGAVLHTLHYGLEVTLGMPVFVTECDGGLTKDVNWHHPPGYWLYLSWFCSWLGTSPTAMRVAHLALYLPWFFALFFLVRRFTSPLIATGFSCSPAPFR